MADDRKLKRLAFVDAYSQKLVSGASYVEGAYKKVRPLVPQPVQPLLTKVEDTMLAYAAPAVAKASDNAEKLLRVTDDQVSRVGWQRMAPGRSCINLRGVLSYPESYPAFVAVTRAASIRSVPSSSCATPLATCGPEHFACDGALFCYTGGPRVSCGGQVACANAGAYRQ
jgi:hypothetical protein